MTDEIENGYIQKCREVYQAALHPNKEYIHEEIVTIPSRFRWFKPTVVKTYTNTLLDEKYKEAKEYIKMKTESEQTFMSLWEFSDFIRWAEKLFIYENSPSNRIYSDAPMNSLESRTFLINKGMYLIYFRLKMSKNPEYDRKKNNLTFHKIIEVVVERKYGKEMKDKFTIVDEHFEYKDLSDIDLMDLINKFLNEALIEVFMIILDAAKNLKFISKREEEYYVER